MLHLRKNSKELMKSSSTYLKLAQLNMKTIAKRELEETFTKSCPKPKHSEPSSKFMNNGSKKTIANFLRSKNTLFDEIIGSEYANPFPFLVTTSLNSQYKSIQSSLLCAIKSIVFNYYHDPRIQDTFKFTPQVQKILEICESTPYVGVGGYR